MSITFRVLTNILTIIFKVLINMVQCKRKKWSIYKKYLDPCLMCNLISNNFMDNNQKHSNNFFVKRNANTTKSIDNFFLLLIDSCTIY